MIKSIRYVFHRCKEPENLFKRTFLTFYANKKNHPGNYLHTDLHTLTVNSWSMGRSIPLFA